jgi:hypothetical protein
MYFDVLRARVKRSLSSTMQEEEGFLISHFQRENLGK